MPSNNDALIPITEAQLVAYRDRVNGYLKKVSWIPGNVSSRARKPGGASVDIYASTAVVNKAQEVSVLDAAKATCGEDDPIILPEEINRALAAVRRGLQIGFHLKDLYAEHSGLAMLMQQQDAAQGRTPLSSTQSTEFAQKQQTSSAILMFVSASYIVQDLSRYKNDTVSNSLATIDAIPELSFQNSIMAARCLLYYYAGALDSGAVRSMADFVKMTLSYFGRVIDEVRMRADALQYAELFTRNHYKLEGSDFSVRGFAFEGGSIVVGVEFRRISLESIVGNRDAKHYARRIVQALLCFDVLAKLSPMVKLGGFTPINMGYGKPGTGKTMINAAIATLIDERARWLGIPFVYHPLPDTIISTYQGGSSERFMDWFRLLNDTSKIWYAPIDDAENVLSSRTRQGSSEGERGVIGSFLRNSEGAYAIIRGNWIIDLFTNIPDQLDAAVLSRVLRRFLINGAETLADILDQDWLWWSKHAELDPDFIDMVDPDGYVWMATQKQLASLSEVYENIGEPKEERVRMVYTRILQEYSPKEHLFYAKLFRGIMEEYPLFSSRDIRNIQSAIDARLMDFDFPTEWMDDADVFFRKDYDTKFGMLVELKKTNMKGLSFSEIKRQETVMYLDNMARIVDGEKERRLAAMVDDIILRFEAERRVRVILEKRGLLAPE